jgi:C-methyltransferase
MSALIMAGVFIRDENGRYANSPGSDQFRSDHPESMRNMVVLLTGRCAQGCGSPYEAVRTNWPALNAGFGVGLYEYVEKDPETSKSFGPAMREAARPVATVLAQHLPLEDVRTIVDVDVGGATASCSRASSRRARGSRAAASTARTRAGGPRPRCASRATSPVG